MTKLVGGIPRSRSSFEALILTALATAGVVTPGDAQVRYAGTVAYSRGSYFFDQTTASFYFDNRLSLDGDRVTLSLSLPLILQQEGAVTWVAGSPTPTGGVQNGLVSGRMDGSTIGARRGKRDGAITDSVLVVDSEYSASLGDPLLGLGADVFTGFGVVRSVRLEGRVKAPITDLGEGSGSGGWDFGAGGSLTLGHGTVLAFADATYWWIEDLPDLELLDRLSYGLGVAVPLTDTGSSVLFGVSGASKTIPSADVPLSLDGAAGFGVGERGFVTLGLSIGLTESSPDLSLQAGFSADLLTFPGG
ncbi:MAG: hypothetical protein HKO53_14065 [Gemmatimonadetes bacterium]|nr:hypothetical protein [Gemmatimonadota bacterium]